MLMMTIADDEDSDQSFIKLSDLHISKTPAQSEAKWGPPYLL